MYLMHVYTNENLNTYFDKLSNDPLNNNGDTYISRFSDVVHEPFSGSTCTFNTLTFVPRSLYLAPGPPQNFAHALDLSFTSTKYICSTCICRLGSIVSSSSFFGPVALNCKWQTQPKILRSNQKRERKKQEKKTTS